MLFFGGGFVRVPKANNCVERIACKLIPGFSFTCYFLMLPIIPCISPAHRIFFFFFTLFLCWDSSGVDQSFASFFYFIINHEF